MKKHLVMALAILFAGSMYAQNGDIVKIWKSGKSDDDKVKEFLALKLKPKNISLRDHYAVTYFLYKAKPVRQQRDSMQMAMRAFEVLTPSAAYDLDTTYPKIYGTYVEIAKENGWHVYTFTAEPNPPIGFEELDDRKYDKGKGGMPPNEEERRDAQKMLRYLTIRIQQSLYHSDNMEIQRFVNEKTNLWLSLNESQKQKMRDEGYWNFWLQQQDCYIHKYNEKAWDCTCSPQAISFPDTLHCGVKELHLDRNASELDDATKILMRLDEGDLTAIPDAKAKGYAIWGNVKEKLIPQMIFWHLATFDRSMIVLVKKTKTFSQDRLNEQMRIALSALWQKGEMAGGRIYEKRIGLDSDIVADLQDYYSCILGVKTVSLVPIEKVISTANAKPAIHGPTDEFFKNISDTSNGKEAHYRRPSHPNVTVIRLPNPVSNLTQSGKPFDVVALAKAMDNDLKEDAKRRENGICPEVRAIGTDTIEMDFSSCGDTGAISFAVGVAKTDKAREFIKYATNTFDGMFNYYRELNLVDTNYAYHMDVLGTTDQIPFAGDSATNTAKQTALGKERAEYLRQFVGSYVLKAVGGIENIGAIPMIEMDARKGIIRARIIKQQGN